MQVVKALIAFDAKINMVNIDDQTPLDLVGRHSNLEHFLVLFGALRYREIQRSRVQGVGAIGSVGRADFLDEAEDDTVPGDSHLSGLSASGSSATHGVELCASKSRSQSGCGCTVLSSLSEG